MNSKINSGEELLCEKKSAFLPISLYILIYFLIAFIVFVYFFAFIPIDGQSMENTIHDGHKCFVLRTCFSVERDDIVTIDTNNSGKEHIIIKRVVGTAGDRLVFMKSEDNKYVDLYICTANSSTFTKLDEPYIKERMLSSSVSFNNIKVTTKRETFRATDNKLIQLLPFRNDITELDMTDTNTIEFLEPYMVTVPYNSIYFLGDNRNTSLDSRYYGARPIDSVTSKVLAIL